MPHVVTVGVNGSQRGWQPDCSFNRVLIGCDGLVKATCRSGVEPGEPALMKLLD